MADREADEGGDVVGGLAQHGAAVAVLSYTEWQANQRALRRGEPLRRSLLPRLLAATIAVIALLAAALALLSAVISHP